LVARGGIDQGPGCLILFAALNLASLNKKS